MKTFKEFVTENNMNLDPLKFLTIDQVAWCNDSIEEAWWVNSDGEVETSENLTIKNTEIEKFEVQFADVKGDFRCEGTKIQSLVGAPRKVGGVFSCARDHFLISLQGAPTEVGSFDCHACGNIKSLAHSPTKVKDLYDCSQCWDIPSLNGAPKKVKRFYCSWLRNVEDLRGCPDVEDELSIQNCEKLKSLRGAPKKVRKITLNSNESLQSLEGGPVEVEIYDIWRCPIKSLEGMPKKFTKLSILRTDISQEELKFLEDHEEEWKKSPLTWNKFFKGIGDTSRKFGL